MLRLTFEARADPLTPVGLVARGAVAHALVRRLLGLGDESLSALRGVATEEAVVILGEASTLPWSDGVRYLGADAEEPSLLLPTTSAPNVPASWLAGVLEREGAKLPAAVLPASDGLDVYPIGEARPLAREVLRAWLERAA